MDKLADKFAELAEKFGPSVVDATLAAARTEAYSTLVGGLVWLAVSAVIWRTARYLWTMKTLDEFVKPLPIIVASMLYGVALICAVAAVWCIVDPWTWTAMSHPEQWIARRVLKL